MNNQYFSRLASKPVKRKFSQEVKSSTKEEFEQTKKKKKKQWKGSRKRYVATSTFSKKTPDQVNDSIKIRQKDDVEDEERKEELRRTKELKEMYRDRAAERQKGLNIDYAQTETMKKVSAEHSKYLGGDLKHTHLVKGLDFALLRKVRDEMKEKLTDSKSDDMGKKKLKSELVFHSHKASSLYRELTRSGNSKVKTFMEGHTSIVFTLDGNCDDDGEVRYCSHTSHPSHTCTTQKNIVQLNTKD